MNHPRPLTFGLVCLLALASPIARNTSTASQPLGQLIVVGGGPAVESVYRHTLDLVGGPAASILVVPQASPDPDAGTKTASLWRSLGATSVAILDTADPHAADLIAAADLIWMRGGEQTRLMQALESANLADPIRRRFAAGATIGGTSAGAAVMSRLMIAGPSRDPVARLENRPETAAGIGLWPEVVVDQHFLKRRRFDRLRNVVLEHPGHIGIGIDEATAVVVRGSRFEVFGESQVVVIDPRHPDPAGSPHVVTLDPGASYHLDRGFLAP